MWNAHKSIREKASSIFVVRQRQVIASCLLKMTPPLSTIILGIQGALLVFNGIASLVSDSWVQMNTKAMELDSNIPAFHALTMASATIGVFYLRMARKNDFTTMWQCFAGRALAFDSVFGGRGRLEGYSEG